MPAVVKKYLETNNLKDVVEEQNNINSLYRQDISKYQNLMETFEKCSYIQQELILCL